MFRGLNYIAVDAKGRVTIPARLRPEIEEHARGRLVITIDTHEPCLLVYLHSDWERIEQKLSALSSFNPATRRIQRLLIGHATEIDLDRNGRILLPLPLREHAGLGQNGVLVGQGNKFELWEETQWRSACDSWIEEEKDQTEDDLPPELASLSL